MPSSPLSLPATNTAGATDTSPSAPSTPFSSFSSQQSNISHAASSQPAPPDSTSQAPSSKLSCSSAQSTSSTDISAPPSRTQASTSPAPTSTTENNKSSKVATTPAQSPLPSGSPLAVSTSTSTLTSSTLVVPESSSISTNQSSSALISQSSASQPSSDIANSSSSSMALTAPQLSSMSAQATAGLSTVISSAVGSVSASSTGAFSVRSTATVGRDTRSHIPAWVFVVIAILATALLAALLYIVWLFKRRARIRALQQRFPSSENSMLWMRQSVGPPVMASTSTTGLIPRERVSPAAASVSPHTVYDGRASPIEADDVSVAQRSQRGRRLWAQLFSTAMSDSDAPMIRGSLQPSIVNPRTSTSRAHSFTSTNTHMLAGSVAGHHASGDVAERAPSILSIPSLRPSGECYGDESLASPTPSAEAAHGNVDLIPRASQINPSGTQVASTTSYYGTSRESSQSSFSLFMTRSESSYPQTPLPVYVRNGEDGAVWPPPVPPIPYESTRLSRSSWLSSSAPSYHTGEAL